MKNNEELIKEIKELISKNRTGKALEILAKEQLSSVDKDLIILNGRYSKVTDDLRMDLIDDDSAQRTINRINLDLLALTEIIGKKADSQQDNTASVISKAPQQQVASGSTHTSDTTDKKNNSKQYLLIGGVVLLLAIAGIWAMLPGSKKANTTSGSTTEVTKDTPKNDGLKETNQNPPPTKPTNEVVDNPVDEPVDKPAEVSPDRLKNIALGQEFEGGIIFYIDPSGQRGLIMAPNDVVPNELYWLEKGKTVAKTGAYKTGIYSGKYNTDAVVKKFGPGIYPAALCQAYDFAGFSDWYLPSQAELDLLYEFNKHKGFKPSYYWSSTEISDADVYYKSFHNGRTYTRLPKGSSYDNQNKARVRAIRTF